MSHREPEKALGGLGVPPPVQLAGVWGRRPQENFAVFEGYFRGLPIGFLQEIDQNLMIFVDNSTKKFSRLTQPKLPKS